MNLTKQTNYAIRVLMYCGAKGERISTIAEIAQAYKVSDLFLAKLIKPLVKANLLESVRGRNGGLHLACPACDINLLDVVKLTESDFAMAECFSSNISDCPLLDNCALNAALAEALQAFFAVLKKYTVEDLIKVRPEIASLLGIPRHEAGTTTVIEHKKPKSKYNHTI